MGNRDFIEYWKVLNESTGAKCVNPFQSNGAFHTDANYFQMQYQSNDWLPYEMQHWPKMG